MYRMSLVLLLLAAKLPMAAEEGVGVTVHQAEWGDARGEAPPPSGPSTPIKADDVSPVFRATGFRYGANLRYRLGVRNSSGIRYQPETRLQGSFPALRSGYRPSSNYRNPGKPMRSMYQPGMRYGSGKNNRSSIRYGFNSR